MLLTDFYSLLAVVGSSMAAGFTALDGAVLIDEPRVTLFGMALGFVILEFFVSIINRFRGNRMDFDADQSTGASARNNGGMHTLKQGRDGVYR